MGRTVASCIIVIMAFTILSCGEEERPSLNVNERKEVNEKKQAKLE